MEITGKTYITGVMGYPVKHSLSPVFQNAAFAALGIDCVYIPMEVAPLDLGKAIEGIKALRFMGVNLTIPHKKAVLKYLDEISEESRILGVVNTVINNGGKLKGDITDGSGFISSLRNDGGFNPRGKKVFIFGAGGSSYAISGALVKEGIEHLYICNRTAEKALLLKKHLSKNMGFNEVETVPFEQRHDVKYWQGTHLLVNTTSMGMQEGDGMPVEEERLNRLQFVYDIVYNRTTALLKSAERQGIPCLGGISMLIYQGAVSFELWTGQKAPVDAMKQSLASIREKAKS